MSKQVASTTIMGAIINILINIVFIKYIGLFAAALSTMISYMIMAIYRHLDLRKYMNIKIESDLLIKSIFMFTFVIICYYINNIYLNIFSLVTAIIYSYLMNKKFLFSSFISVKNKIIKR